MKSTGPAIDMRVAVRRLIVVVSAIVCLAGSIPAGAQDTPVQPKSIRVVADDNYPPYLFRDSDGHAQGYLVDYWKLWEKKTGIHVDFVPMKWSAAQETIQSGQADVIDTIFETQPRRKLYDFTRPYVDLPVNIYTHRTISGVTGKATLKGFLVGVMSGDACVDILAEAGITHLKMFPSYTELILGADRGEVKVFCLDEGPADFYFYRLKAGSDFRMAFQLYVGQFHRAVRKGDVAMLQLVQRGMDMVSPSEQAELRRKWFGSPVGIGNYGRPIGLALLAITVAGSLLLLWNLMLRHRVKLRTSDLQRALTELREAQRVNDDYRQSLEQRVAERTSELTRAARSLQQSNEEQQAVFDAATVGIALNRNGAIRSCNRTLETMFGYGPDELIGKTMRVLYPDDTAFEEFGRRLEQSPEERGAFRQESELVRKDGSRFWCCTMVQSIAQHEPDNGFAVTFEDVTVERKALAEIQRARRLAEEAAAAKSDFLANMSHEIRTPMNVIIGMTHLAQRLRPPAKVMDYLGKIDRSSKHLLGVINDILDFSKAEAGKMMIENVSFDLRTVVESAAELFSEGIADKGLRLEVDLPRDLPTSLVGDSLRISQILINYLNNAVKFTDAGEITIAVRMEEWQGDVVWLRFSVQDTGIGLTNEQQQRLFQGFQQADTSTSRKFGGTGLGLAISKRLAELMGGRVGVESTPGKGSTFWFSIPLKRSVVAGQGTLVRSAVMPGCVLVVDGDKASREAQRKVLEGMGVEVTAVTSGSEALAELRRGSETGNPYGLVLLAWKMPELDGVAVASRIRELSLHRLPRVCMVTNHDSEELQRLIKPFGDVEVLTEPVTAAMLHKSLARLSGPGVTMQDGPGQPSVEPERQAADVRGARALLVEDNELNQEVAREILEEFGLIVDVAANGLVAVDTLKTQNYDVVLMDMQMPVMDGIEATRRIRQDTRNASLPIIAMTASVMQNDQQKCLDAGMNDYVAKPIEPDLLLRTLLKWIEPKSAAPSLQRPAYPSVSTRESEVLKSLESVVGLDCAQGLRRVSGKAALYLSLIARFAASQGRTPKEIAAALESGDMELALRLSHTLKSVSGNIGAIGVMDAAASLEAAIREKRPSEQLGVALALLERLLEGVVGGVTSALKPEVAKTGGRTDAREVEGLYSRLKSLLVNGDADVSELFEENADVIATAFPGEYAALKEHVRMYDYEAALSVLEKARVGQDA